MRFGILGATQALGPDGAEVALGGPRRRALLALLLLDAGRPVSGERLIDGLYGEGPPAGAGNAVQSQVSRLRQVLPVPIEDFRRATGSPSTRARSTPTASSSSPCRAARH